jgi:hypothetical protein
MSIWKRDDTMRGEEWALGQWLVLRRNGDKIFNVLRDGQLQAIGFKDAHEAIAYAEKMASRP